MKQFGRNAAPKKPPRSVDVIVDAIGFQVVARSRDLPHSERERLYPTYQAAGDAVGSMLHLYRISAISRDGGQGDLDARRRADAAYE